MVDARRRGRHLFSSSSRTGVRHDLAGETQDRKNDYSWRKIRTYDSRFDIMIDSTWSDCKNNLSSRTWHGYLSPEFVVAHELRANELLLTKCSNLARAADCGLW